MGDGLSRNRPQIVCRGGKGDETVPPPGKYRRWGTDYLGNRPQIVCRGGKGDETVPPPGEYCRWGTDYPETVPGQSVGAARGRTRPAAREYRRWGTDYLGNRPQIVCRGGEGDETVPPPGNTADGGRIILKPSFSA